MRVLLHKAGPWLAAPLLRPHALRLAPPSLRPRGPETYRTMLASIKRALGVGADACAGCDPAVLAQCEAAEAGSVTPHFHHVFIKLAPPSGSVVAGDEWWAESVDKEPAIEAVNAAIKAAGDRVSGKVKVTAFDGLAPAPLAPGTADCYIFPAGLRFRELPLELLPAAVVAALEGTGSGSSGEGGGDGSSEAAAAVAAAAAPQGEAVQGMTLFVCCHTARDQRCGHIGPPLAAKLAELAQGGSEGGSSSSGGGGVAVLKTSHIGGHKYAGNVLVYSRGKSVDGDWFGGLNAQNAGAFLDALLDAKAPSGAAGEAALRPWWRGRVGLSKAEQVQHFEAAVRDIEDLR